MFYWPHCELTPYELQWVRLYKTGKFPGVLRRIYQVLLNSTANPNVPGLEVPHTSGQVQISRRSRVFGLSFAGDTSQWRVSIESASGERYTPVNPGAPQTPSAFSGVDPSQAPIVASMCPGSFFSPASSLGAPTLGVSGEEGEFDGFATFNEFRLPLLIEPNWELVPNETLIFTGTALADNVTLEVACHVWEFPKWEGC